MKRVALMALVGLLGACTPQQRQPSTEALDSPLRTESGVEVQVWTVTLGPQDMLNELAEADTGDGSITNAETWRANALRVYRVRRDDLPRLRASLRRTGPAERRWLAPDGTWQRLADAGAARDRRILLDSGPFQLDGERPELLVRAWLEPVIDGSAVGASMRIEFLPRIADAGRAPVGFRVDRPGADGLPLERLSAALGAVSGEAIVIAAFDPMLTVQTEDEEPDEDNLAHGPPLPPGPPIFGEAVLRLGTIPRGGYADRPAGLVVVLIPSVPEHFSLLGRGSRR